MKLLDQVRDAIPSNDGKPQADISVSDFEPNSSEAGDEKNRENAGHPEKDGSEGGERNSHSNGGADSQSGSQEGETATGDTSPEKPSDDQSQSVQQPGGGAGSGNSQPDDEQRSDGDGLNGDKNVEEQSKPKSEHQVGAGANSGKQQEDDRRKGATDDSLGDIEKEIESRRDAKAEEEAKEKGNELDPDEDPDWGPEKHGASSPGSEEAQQEREKRQVAAALEELSRRADRFQAGDDGSVTNITYRPREAGDGDAEKWVQARQYRGQLMGVLRTRLEQRERDDIRRGQRAGVFDEQFGYRYSTLNFNARKRRIEGDERKYEVVICLDRSGSMRYDIDIAEVIVSAFADGLEELGVEVTIVDLYKSNAELVKPKTVPVDAARERLTCGRTGGGTPLTDFLELAHAQLWESAADQPFVMVVTDGQPADIESYTDQLDQIRQRCPVVGTTLVDEGKQTDEKFSQQEEFFDAHQFVTDPEEIGKELQQLAYNIMF